MRVGALLAAISLPCTMLAQDPIQRILARVAEEADVFLSEAPKILGEETLRQKARKGRSRFRLRLGKPPPPRFRTREIVSEYGYSALKDSPNVLHEFRQVISVDGRQIKSREKARRTLTLGVTSRDDRLKKRMLKDFERYGLKGAATDFGQLILLFGKRRLGDYQFKLSGRDRIGPDEVVRLTFRQTGGEDGITIFEGRKVIRSPLEGQLWVRDSDSLPIRIRLRALRERGDHVIRDEATVDYVMSAHGMILPASVVHRQFADSKLVVENLFQYSSFRKFTAQVEIKFTEVPLKSPPNK